MDPVTIAVCGVIALVAIPTVSKLALYGAVKLGKKIKMSLKERKAYKLRHNEKYQNKLKRTREVKRAIESRRAVAFKNTKTGAIKNVNINEISSFNFDKDVILKGTVYVANPNGGEPAQDTIYLFQPRVYGGNNVSIGPKIDKNGHLYDNNSYLLRTPGDPDIYSGYVPKREVISGREFDYVSDSFNKGNDPLNNFINIVIEKDVNGRYIPLNKNNVEEMEKFRKYIQKRQEQNIDQNMYLDGLLAKAQLAKAKYDEATKPRFAKPTKQKVTKSRKSSGKRKPDYRDAVIGANMMDSIMHNYGLDEHASHLMPGMRMPMGPGGPTGGQPPQGGPSGGRKR